MSRLFVTGSGTGIGKTLVVQLLIAALRRRARPVRALKPIVTGFDPDAPQSSDSALLLDALGIAVDTRELDRVSPWRFRAPLSPNMAAEREARSIPFADLIRICQPSDDDALTIIEGVGGVMVPIDKRHTVVDWIAAVGCPAVLVTGTYLGTISHTLTALSVLEHAAVEVRGIVVSESLEQPAPLEETVRAIAERVHGPSVVALPRLTNLAHAPELLTALDLAG